MIGVVGVISISDFVPRAPAPSHLLPVCLLLFHNTWIILERTAILSLRFPVTTMAVCAHAAILYSKKKKRRERKEKKRKLALNRSQFNTKEGLLLPAPSFPPNHIKYILVKPLNNPQNIRRSLSLVLLLPCCHHQVCWCYLAESSRVEHSKVEQSAVQVKPSQAKPSQAKVVSREGKLADYCYKDILQNISFSKRVNCFAMSIGRTFRMS